MEHINVITVLPESHLEVEENKSSMDHYEDPSEKIDTPFRTKRSNLLHQRENDLNHPIRSVVTDDYDLQSYEEPNISENNLQTTLILIR